MKLVHPGFVSHTPLNLMLLVGPWHMQIFLRHHHVRYHRGQGLENEYTSSITPKKSRNLTHRELFCLPFSLFWYKFSVCSPFSSYFLCIWFFSCTSLFFVNDSDHFFHFVSLSIHMTGLYLICILCFWLPHSTLHIHYIPSISRKNDSYHW